MDRPIDREALVRRHNPVLLRPDPLSPFTVGNGEFAFTADVTGLQTFTAAYTRIPLCTQAQWAWHTAPLPADLPSELSLETFEAHGRAVGYPTRAEGQEPLFRWLRENPHRLHLGRIGLHTLDPGARLDLADLSAIMQTLDLWTGLLDSRFTLGGTPVRVRTCAHPLIDSVAVTVESDLVANGRLGLVIAFPYGSPGMAAADWDRPDGHSTDIIDAGDHEIVLRRRLDADEYHVAAVWSPGAALRGIAPHTLVLRPPAGAAALQLTLGFSREGRGVTRLPMPPEVEVASADHWRRFWSDGAAVELAGSTDSRANELERRIVLSQYLTAVQCAGSLPPQETGLTCNSWYGKFHLEMHWWHAAHFPLWARTHLLERSLGWYRDALPAARATARAQGYAGARWPKMVGPEAADSPSSVGPLLIWQQPHPITYAEFCYREDPTPRTLWRYAEIVEETAAFMASFAHFEERAGRCVLGPPVIPAQENHPPRTTWNPTFELAYWRHGLELAQQWRQRLGLSREPRWDHVLAHLPPLPVADGVYLAHENCPDTYTERNRDHPSMLAALGVLPGVGVDRDIMRRTLRRVLDTWRWDLTWGWDYPMVAMTAARLGEPAAAVDALLMDTPKNVYLTNGHNWQRDSLPVYLPGNGGLLTAVALMVAGWEGSPPGHAPGFPADGTWTVRWEGLRAWL